MMKAKRFIAKDMRHALADVRAELGDDAVILSNRRCKNGVEVVAAPDYKSHATSSEEQPTPRQAAVPETSVPETGVRSERPRQSQRRVSSAEISMQALPATEPEMNHASIAHAPTAHAPTAHAETGHPELNALRGEIELLKNMLGRQLLSPDESQDTVTAVLKQGMHDVLAQQGFSDSFSERVLANFNVDDMPQRWEKLREKIKHEIRVINQDITDTNHIIALVGAPGVGKTTTLSKMAAHFVLRHGAGALGLITTDQFRIGAEEQILSLGRILGVEVTTLRQGRTLEDGLRSFHRKKLVLIDTAGLGAHDAACDSQLNMFRETKRKIGAYLVLPCTSQRQVIENMVSLYRSAGLAGCILSKMDEALSLGEVLDPVIENRLPIAYTTYGQNIPDDIDMADPDQIVDQAIPYHPQEDEPLAARLSLASTFEKRSAGAVVA